VNEQIVIGCDVERKEGTTRGRGGSADESKGQVRFQVWRGDPRQYPFRTFVEGCSSPTWLRKRTTHSTEFCPSHVCEYYITE
jgi:hypothetical protein